MRDGTDALIAVVCKLREKTLVEGYEPVAVLMSVELYVQLRDTWTRDPIRKYAAPPSPSIDGAWKLFGLDVLVAPGMPSEYLNVVAGPEAEMMRWASRPQFAERSEAE